MWIDDDAAARAADLCPRLKNAANWVRALLGTQFSAACEPDRDRVAVTILDGRGERHRVFEVVPEMPDDPLPRPYVKGACVVENVFDAQIYCGRIGLLEVPGVRPSRAAA